MKFTLLVSILGLTTAASLERRKSFIETHQEHGHLPGGSNNPGPMALVSQVMQMLQGNNPAQILNQYNQAADEKNGVEGTNKASKGGMMSALGLEDIPIVGGLI